MFRIVCIISKWAADAFGKASLYDELIKMNNYPHFDQRNDNVYNETADDMIDKSKDICAIPLLNNTVASLQALLQATTFSGFPVVTSLSEMLIVGFMSRSNMEAVLQQALDECAFCPKTPVPDACVFHTLISSFYVADSTPLVPLPAYSRVTHQSLAAKPAWIYRDGWTLRPLPWPPIPL